MQCASDIHVQRDRIARSLRQQNFSVLFLQAFMIMYSRLTQTIVLSSQTEKIMLTTTFSHSLGLKHCKKPNFEKIFTYFLPVQAFQSFTT